MRLVTPLLQNDKSTINKVLLFFSFFIKICSVIVLRFVAGKFQLQIQKNKCFFWGAQKPLLLKGYENGKFSPKFRLLFCIVDFVERYKKIPAKVGTNPLAEKIVQLPFVVNRSCNGFLRFLNINLPPRLSVFFLCKNFKCRTCILERRIYECYVNQNLCQSIWYAPLIFFSCIIDMPAFSSHMFFPTLTYVLSHP